jgi:hypothetical protein
VNPVVSGVLQLDTPSAPPVLFSSFRFKVSRAFVPGGGELGPIVWSDLTFRGGDAVLLPRLLRLVMGLESEPLPVHRIALQPLDADYTHDVSVSFYPDPEHQSGGARFWVTSVTPTPDGEFLFTLGWPGDEALPTLEFWPCLAGFQPAPIGPSRPNKCLGTLPVWAADPRPTVATIELPSGQAAPLVLYSIGAQQAVVDRGPVAGKLEPVLTAFRFTKAIDGALSPWLWTALHYGGNLGTVTIAAPGGVTYTLSNTHVTEIEYLAERNSGLPASENVALGFTNICITTALTQTCWDVVTKTGTGGQP